jgi:hypothetical protein
LQVLNKILDFMHVGKHQPFTSDFLHNVAKYNGSDRHIISDAEEEAVYMLRRAISKPLLDLENMLSDLELNEFFPGLPIEI